MTVASIEYWERVVGKEWARSYWIMDCAFDKYPKEKIRPPLTPEESEGL
jgi:hypothetical protein